MCTSLVLMTAAIISYEVWAQIGIFKMPEADVTEVETVQLNCGPGYFWGHGIRYKRSGDGYEGAGRVCRDWINGKWLLFE